MNDLLESFKLNKEVSIPLKVGLNWKN